MIEVCLIKTYIYCYFMAPKKEKEIQLYFNFDYFTFRIIVKNIYPSKENIMNNIIKKAYRD